LFLARDRLGQKPLVYHETGGRLSFASEIKSLLQIPGLTWQPDPEAIDLYLTYSYVPHPWTMFSGIRKLPPAHCAIYRNGQLTIRRYWDPDLNAESQLDEESLRRQLRSELHDAVRLRLRSDVPLGAFLSGGIDSTAIVGLMQQNLPQPARTFTIGFPEAAYDESAFARKAAEHLGTNHAEFQVASGDLDLLPTLTWHFDEPFADSSAIPTFRVAEVARQHVKVALTGDGGDELFAGYPRYRTVHQLRHVDSLPQFLASNIFGDRWMRLAGDRGNRSPLSKLAFRMQILGQNRERRYVHWLANLHANQRQSLYKRDFERALNGTDSREIIADAMSRCRDRGPGTQAMLTDLQTYLPCDLLAKVDITSMAHGLECRSPFLDHRVVELAMAIPFRFHARSRSPKPMITRTFQEFFPPALRKRSKMGFSAPLDAWFRGPLKNEIRSILLDGRATHCYFRREAISELLEQHASGRWNHGERIWALMCFDRWHRMFVEAGSPAIQPPTDNRFEVAHADNAVIAQNIESMTA
jgi:asparagine synthase (glutamine-hydrolysing)